MAKVVGPSVIVANTAATFYLSAARGTRHCRRRGTQRRNRTGDHLRQHQREEEAQARIPTCGRKCTKTGLAAGVSRGVTESPPKPKQLPRLPPSAEGRKNPSPEVAQGSAEEAEPMEEAPCERPEGGAEPRGSDGTLGAKALLDAREILRAGPKPTTGEPAAEGTPAEKQPPRPPLPSDGDDAGPKPGVSAEEGVEETSPVGSTGSANNLEPAQLTPAEGPEGGEEPESAQKNKDREPGPQPTTEGPEGGEEPESAQDGCNVE
ncbi:dynein axonemal assembly factor 1-like [Acipenser ruthenus]|uniref:dynein axonemal assembly factor 1-like n=1 Tax=Acipenser ruthenus TaxID=7906 RepID=UPI0015601289|nr:dynein axonemal assembly factor 1-like [Acipenser ruthenus]